ncbi:DUF6843 domain-containing protein [Jeotgalibacillus aurantiacus]|uniref:DUF6843 domain-containing protein n=1 Tax=Jeotgalibacillus aurantiacus TaxID=2763266 RepID=UPI001D0A6915|nr:hypothetical protein [Jeotgalibacillus aurantiacus]
MFDFWHVLLGFGVLIFAFSFILLYFPLNMFLGNGNDSSVKGEAVEVEMKEDELLSEMDPIREGTVTFLIPEHFSGEFVVVNDLASAEPTEFEDELNVTYSINEEGYYATSSPDLISSIQPGIPINYAFYFVNEEGNRSEIAMQCVQHHRSVILSNDPVNLTYTGFSVKQND